MAARKRKEPVRPRRSSVLVARRAVPASIRSRLEVERLLRVHDPDLAEKARSVIKPAQLTLVRRIALDQSTEGDEIVLRKHAIAILGSLGAIEDLNLLSDLARFDREPGIRAEALVGLGKSGVALATPVLVHAIASDDPVEAAAASKALEILVTKAGDSAIRLQIAKAETRERRLATAVVDRLAAPAKARRQRQSKSLRDTLHKS
jgi:hypothetical protein